MALTIDVSGNNTLVLSGHIDEDAQFGNSGTDLSGSIRVNLEGVKSINSVGIRSWLGWLQKFEGKQLVFEKCPRCIVMQMNMVEGFLPEGSVVESFFVPFYSETYDEEYEPLFTVGQEINVANGVVEVKFDPKSLSESEDAEIEMDVNEDKYFRFLRGA